MKNNQITIGFHDPKLEAYILKKDAELKELAKSNARHFAKSHRPTATGDRIEPYIGPITAGYQHLIAHVQQYLQPNSLAPNAQIESEHFNEKNKELENDIAEKKALTNNLENDLKDHNSSSIILFLMIALFLTTIVMLGEIGFNISAFQEWGDNKLTAFWISFAVSLGVFIVAHSSAHQYKRAETKLRRFLILLFATLLVSIPFYVIAILRTQSLLSEDVQSNPMGFALVNFFLFFISFLISLFLMPDLEDIKEHLLKWKWQRAVIKGRREEEKMKKQKKEMVDEITKNTTDRVNIGFYAINTIKRIKMLHKEAIELFKSTNLSLRTDSKTPDCFYTDIPELDDDFNFTFNTNK